MASLQNHEQNPSPQLTTRFTDAVDYARQIHTGFRKGTQVPYMAHLLGVVSLVLGESGDVKFPVTEDMAIAALLHDAVEDEGGLRRLRDIEAKFGKQVAKVVEGCTDSFEEDPTKKQEWEIRKSSYMGGCTGRGAGHYTQCVGPGTNGLSVLLGTLRAKKVKPLALQSKKKYSRKCNPHLLIRDLRRFVQKRWKTLRDDPRKSPGE